MMNIVGDLLRRAVRQEIVASGREGVLVLGDLQRLPFVLKGSFRVLWHLASRVEAHLVLHGLRLIGGYERKQS